MLYKLRSSLRRLKEAVDALSHDPEFSLFEFDETELSSFVEDSSEYRPPVKRKPLPASPNYIEPGDVTNDEQTVNLALHLLIYSLTMHHPESSAHSSMHRLGFQMRSYFEARTDGYLKTRRSNKVWAIYEVKRYRRVTNKAQVQMQESAQMAAWIAERPQDFFVRPGKKYRHLK
jgi:hypothetical protein